MSNWPAGVIARLEQLGLLVPLSPATVFSCDACGFDHAELVQWQLDAGTGPRVSIPCPHVGVVPVDPAALRRWAVRLPAIASAVGTALGATGGTTERAPSRVWKLGTIRTGGRVWVGFLAAGLTRADGAAVIESVPELRAANALVFVPAAVPPTAVWSADRAPTVVPLTDLLHLGATGLTTDREFLTSALPADTRPSAQEATRTFSAPPNATWEQVALIVEDHHVRVRVGDVVERFGFAEAGFADRRAKGAPDDLWGLLGLLARFRGVLGTGDTVGTKPGGLRQKIGTLRARLRALVGIEADPFHPNRKGHPYRARFAIWRDGPLTFPTPPGTTWDDLTLSETRAGIRISVTAESRSVTREFDDEGVARRTGSVETGERQFTHSLADLGLEVGDGEPAPAGTALLNLLRAGGRLARSRNAPELLALGKALSRFFGIDDPPLTFDPARARWVARFEAESLVPPSERS